MGASVNLRTGKIVGAEEGSFAWWHEKAHIIYDDSELGIRTGVQQNMCVYCSLLLLVLGNLYSIFNILAGIVVFYLIGLVIFEEKWCDRYASKMLKERKDINLGEITNG